jgi:uncharacterized protein YxjI
MKLYIKQKVFSWGDRFLIKDEEGGDRYSAQGEILSWGRKLHLFDGNGQEVAFIRQKLLTWLSRYFIEIDNQTYTLVKEFTFLHQRFHLDELPWVIEGNFSAHEYMISQGEEIIMSMSKHWLTWGDSYELDIPNPEHELLCLCIALGIDCMVADQSRS